MKISDALWEAANVHLSCTGSQNDGKQDFSCVAIREVGGCDDLYAFHALCIAFVKELGCPAIPTKAFHDLRAGERRQGARYLWLMFAYLVAMDEGL